MKKLMIILFVVLALGADLKVTIFPYIHWITWLVLIVPLIIIGVFNKGIVVSPMLGIGTLLIFIGMLSSFFSGADLENFIQIIKLLLIFITLYYFLYYSNIGWKEANMGINISLVINFILLILGIFGFTAFASLMTADGRWGTFMAYPGSLVKIGALGFYFNLMAVLLRKERKVKIIHLILSLISLFIVYMDGSRTGMLVLMLTFVVVYLFYILINFKNKLKVVIIPLVTFILLLSTLIVNLPYILQSRIATSITKLMSTSTLSNGLELVDSSRFMMIKSALNKIYDSPIIGSGAFTTVGVYEDGTSMVVHNTYLQFWGDFGVFGLIGLLLLYFSWTFFLPNSS
jgi:O-antigen ligase